MIWIACGLGLVGVLLSALFSGAETGFYRATRLRLVLDAMGGATAARGLLFLTNHPSLFVATTLVGNSLATYLVSLAMVVVLRAVIPGPGTLVPWIAPLVAAPVLLVYGELLPKNLFLQAPNRLLRRFGPLFLVFVVLLLPLSAWLWGSSRLLARLLRVSPKPIRSIIARRELRRVLEEGHEAGILHPAQRSLARGIFAAAGRPVVEFLVPVGQMPRAQAGMSKQDVLALAERCRAAVIPVESATSAGSLAGYVRVIDLALSDSPELGPVRPLLEIRDNSTLLAVLTRLESANEGLAAVTNARGETIGIVTTRRLREPLLREG
ncbi:MAG: CNNM domain-containing protein [Thermoguttaceae bacterium]